MSRDRTNSRRRRGAIYIITLATALVVSLLAVAALTMSRIQRRQNTDLVNQQQAQANARLGLEMAIYQSRYNGSWRSQMASGAWNSAQNAPAGTYSFSAVDPVDGNLTNNNFDRVTITATGVHGNATHKLRSELRLVQPGLTALDGLLHAGGNLVTRQTTLTANGLLSANGNASLELSSTVKANVAAAGSVVTSGGSVVNGTATNSAASRTMPVLTDMLTYYSSIGTTIPFTSIPYPADNRLVNPGIESGVSPWGIVNWGNSESALLLQDVLIKRSGLAALSIDLRSHAWAGPAQDISSMVYPGAQVSVTVWCRKGTGSAVNLVVRVYTKGSGDSTMTTHTSSAETVGTSWKDVNLTATLNWNGTLETALVAVESTGTTEPFYIDDAVLSVTNGGAAERTIHRALFSPASNPFGSANAQGVYVIDCGGSKLMLRDARIVGTLVLKNLGAGSKLDGGLVWTPTQVYADPNSTNYCGLITQGDIEIAASATLNETAVNKNFNPSSTPYSGTSDSDTADSYSSLLRGVYYASGNGKISSSLTLEGAFVAGGNLTVEPPSGTLTMTARSLALYRYLNAPKGMQDTVQVRFTPGSAQRVVD